MATVSAIHLAGPKADRWRGIAGAVIRDVKQTVIIFFNKIYINDHFDYLRIGLIDEYRGIRLPSRKWVRLVLVD